MKTSDNDKPEGHFERQQCLQIPQMHSKLQFPVNNHFYLACSFLHGWKYGYYVLCNERIYLSNPYKYSIWLNSTKILKFLVNLSFGDISR